MTSSTHINTAVRAARSHSDLPAPVLIIGAGQAGLALAAELSIRGINSRILDAAETIGESWARRWESLRLFTPVEFDSLPGVRFPGVPSSHPGKDDVANYLRAYVDTHALEVSLRTRIVELRGDLGGFVAVDAAGREWRAERVVVATGAFGAPVRPAWTSLLGPHITQLHTDQYRTPADLPKGYSLVVGAGNSGVQIALELARNGHRVDLAQGRAKRHLPQRWLGKDVFFWLHRAGLLGATVKSPAGRMLRRSDPVIGTRRRDLSDAAVTFRPRAIGAAFEGVRLADGSMSSPKTVVWATGYRHDDSWVRVPGALHANGTLITRDGQTPVAGLHTIGRSWQRDRGSALLGFVGRDAERLAVRLT